MNRSPALVCWYYRCPASVLQYAIERGFPPIADDQPVAGHGAHQMVELCFYRGEVGKDVRMIELEIIEDRGARMVVHELGSFIEKCRVVLICLDDEERRLGQPRGNAEILWHPAYQETWIESRTFEYPGQHGAGGCLSVRACDTQYPLGRDPAPQYIFSQPLRSRDIRQIAIEYFLHQRISARYHVSDDIHIGVKLKLIYAKAFDQRYTLGFQLGTHRRIDVGVASGHAIARLFRQRGNAAHERAADPQYMQRGWLFGVHLAHSSRAIHWE